MYRTLDFQELFTYYELHDLCKGYGQAYLYCQDIDDVRFRDWLLRQFKNMTPEQRYMVAYY